MVRTSRRRVLAGCTLAALSGCLGGTSNRSSPTETSETPTDTETPSTTTTTDGEPEPDPEQEITEGVAAALAPFPQSAGDTSLSALHVFEPRERQQQGVGLMAMGGVTDALGLQQDEVDRIGYAIYGESSNILISIAGSFEASAPSPPEDSSPIATYREDGLFLGAADTGNDAWDRGLEVAKSTLEDDSAGVLTDDTIESLIRPISQKQTIVAFPSYPAESMLLFGGGSSEEIDGLSAAAIGADLLEDRVVEFTAVGLFESESTVSEADIQTVVSETFDLDASDVATQQDGRRLLASGRYQLPAQPSYEASPDADISVRYDTEQGVAVLEHHGGDSVDTEALTLTVDGEQRDGVWSVDALTAGTTVEFDAQPFDAYRIKWTDPEDEDVFDYLDSGVLTPRDVFEHSYDADANTVTFTYTGEQTVSTENLVLERRAGDGPRPDDQFVGDGEGYEPPEETEIQLSERYDSLETGDEVVLEEVSYYDQASIVASVEWDNSAMSSSVAFFTPRPPGHFHLDTEGDPTLVYEGHESHDAADYRVTIGGEAADIQFTDEYTTLSSGDRLTVEPETGAVLRIEWLGADEPVTVFAHRFAPPVSFDLQRDREVFDLTYTAETEWPAAEFDIRLDREPADASFTAEFETLTSGDTLELEPTFEYLQVLWTGASEPMEVHSTRISFSTEFELSYTDGSAELTFDSDGSWPAEEFEILLDDEPAGVSFADQYETITAGDSISFDAELGSRLQVNWTAGSRDTRLYSETISPTLDFEFAYDSAAEEVTITSATDADIPADQLTVELLGEDRAERPDEWSSEYDTVQNGDQITLSVSDGVEAVVVVNREWGDHQLYELGSEQSSSAGGSE